MMAGMRVIALCLAALGVGVAGGAAAETLRVGKPAPGEFNFATPEIGMGAGIFQNHGLTLEVVTLLGSAKLHQAMVAGSIDIALGAGTDFMFIAKGAPEKAIATICGPPANYFIAVPANSPIKTIADLKGKRISVSTVGSLSYWFVQELSRRQGWGDDGVVYVPSGGAPATLAGFKSGNIDAAFQSLEGGLQMEAAGDGQVIFSFADFVHPFITHAMFASNDLMAQQPEVLRRFLAAWFETIAFAKTHKDETIRYAAEVTRVPPTMGAKIYDVQMPAFSDDGRFDPAAVKVVLDSLLAMKQIDHIPDTASLLTEEFLPARQ